jgi:hypothetical protein
MSAVRMLKSMKYMPAFFYFHADPFSSLAVEALRRIALLFVCHISYNTALAEKMKCWVM